MAYKFEWGCYRVTANERFVSEEEERKGPKFGPVGRLCTIEERKNDGTWERLSGVKKFTFEITPKEIPTVTVTRHPYVV